jgi:hypothetical protein
MDVEHALERAEWHWDDDERCEHYLAKVAEQVRDLKLLRASDARMKRLSRRGTR